MGEVIYLNHFDAGCSAEADEFVLTYAPIRSALPAGRQPLHECGLPRFGRPLPNAHDWEAVPENSPLAQYRVRASTLLE